jgi:hypothetical protein
MNFGFFVPDDRSADKSMEEILKEADDLVRETCNSFPGLSDSSDLLKLPITPGLIRGMAVNLMPESTASKKRDKHFITEEKGKEVQSSMTRGSTLSTSYRKTDSKSTGSKVRDRGEQLRGMSPRKKDSRSGTEEFAGDKFGDSRQLMYPNTHENIGARIDDMKVGSVISESKSEKHLRNYSGSISKEKDVLKKERTVTFEDGLHLFPEPTDSINKKHKDIVQTSSQKLQQVESISNRKSDEISNKDDDLFALESATLQQSTGDGLSTREDERVDQLTKEISVSRPLIQHGDVVAALQEPKNSCSQDSDHSSFNIEKEMENIFGHGDSAGNTMVDSWDGVGISFPRKPQSVVLEESNVSDPFVGVDKLKDASTMTEGSDRFVQASDSSVAEHVDSLEKELLHERSTSLQLKSMCVKVL